jgi:hypothetical protein
MKTKLPTIRQAFDGEWFSIKHEGFLIVCCDCGLTHSMDMRMKDVSAPHDKDYGLFQVELRVRRMIGLTRRMRAARDYVRS